MFSPAVAGEGQGPAAQGLNNDKESGGHQQESEPEHIIHQHNPGDEAERSVDAPRNAAIASDVGPEEFVHRRMVTKSFCVASGAKFGQIRGVSSMNTADLLVSLVWGSVGSGYLIYGWRQKASIPLAGGAAMTLVSYFFPALPMTLVCVAAIVMVHWLIKRGY